MVTGQLHRRQDERHEAITEAVLAAGTLRIEELAETYDVSIQTIHRDLDALQAQGILRKSRGSVTALASSLVESSPEYRARENRRAKESIARAAIELVEPGQALILDDSTTALSLAELLPARQPITVISNFQRVLATLTGHPGVAVISPGGQHYQWCDAYMGTITYNAIAALRADLLFMSTPAIIDDICFHQHHEAAQLKRAMFESAERRVLVVDHSKFSKRALHGHIPLARFDTVIVDAATSTEDIERVRDLGVEVLVAPSD